MNNFTTIKIPKKYQSMLEEVYRDSDGYWAYSKPGFYFPSMECHTAHEDTQHNLLRVIREITDCKCDECMAMLRTNFGVK